jgi:uncharacterized Zn-binding protein involved in type VI secretion
MGKPAARIGDMCMHGGTVVVGCPTVLIGGMPAARLGDMHVCPMATPAPVPVPHVGGPISLGSPMVLIGGMPAARMGDMAVCVGPPDTIVLGCMTVLIGEGGSGAASGGGAGGAGAPASIAAQASASTALFDNNESTTKEEHWVEIQFVDKAGKPVSRVPYKFTDTENKETEDVLRLDGTIRRDGIKEGQCKVQLFSVSNAKWSKEEAEVGEQVKMKADIDGFKDGTMATFEIYKRDLKGADVVVETIAAEVKGGKVEDEWEYVIQNEKNNIATQGEIQQKYSIPEYYFDVIVAKSKARSNLLMYKDWIDLKLKDDEGNAIGDIKYKVFLPNGEMREGTLDGQGYAKVEDIPPGKFQVKFDFKSK